MEVFIGTIQPFAFNFAPRGWAFCAGQLISIAQNTAMFSLLGTTFGGDGQTTLGLPDLRGRTAIGFNQGPAGPGLQSYAMGQKSGVESYTLLSAQMPIHTHAATFTGTGGGGGGGGTATVIKASIMQATQSIPGTAGATTLAAPYYTDGPAAILGYVNDPNPTITLAGVSGTGSGGGGITGGTIVNAVTGGSQPFSLLQPYLAINYCIATEGIFPSRN